MMVSSAVLGAAAGTGLALVIAVTIVVYRYYTAQGKVKSWSSLDRWPDPPKTNIIGHNPSTGFQAKILRQQLKIDNNNGNNNNNNNNNNNSSKNNGKGDIEAACHLPLDCYGKKPCYCAVQSTEFNVTREHHAVQPSSSTDSAGSPSLGQQSSRPSSRMGLVMGRTLTSLSRQASTSSGSQEQLPSSEQQSPSPQIRTYGPDGRHHNDALHAASSYPPSRGSRSPSPVRAASLDARTSCCPSPLQLLTSGQSGSGSLSSLASPSLLAGGSPKLPPTPLSATPQQQQQQQQQLQSPGRCLSPLLIPPPRASFSLGDSGSGPPASPLGALQPDLYRSRVEPIILPSSSRRSGKSLGRLHLRLSYDYDKSDLEVHLIKGENIPSSDHGGFNDPYIKLTLSPEVDARKRQTPVWGNEANPQFDQHFKFPVSHEELQDKTLILQVLDFDRTSRNDMFGSVRVNLDELNLTSSTSPVEIVGDISRERKPPEETQEVLISLSYLPSAQRLTLVVHRARNLFPASGKDSLDPFVKVGLLSNDRRVKKKKTAVCKATRSPVWDEAMSFNVPTSALGSSAIEICVVDSSREASAVNDAIIGTCIIGPGIGTNYDNTPNPSREHWLVMANSPRQTISKWHVLH